MKTKILLFILWASFSIVKGQNVTVNWGPELKTKRSFVVQSIVHGDKTGFYVLKGKVNMASAYGAAYASMFSFGLAHTKIKVTQFIEKYDNKFNLVFSKDFTSAIPGYDYDDMFWSKNRMMVFSTQYDKSSKTNTAYETHMDKNGEVANKNTKLMSLDIEKKRDKGAFDFEYSPDTSKILVYAFAPSKKDDNQKINFKVFDNDMKIMWSKDVTLPYKDKMIDISSYRVTNDGDVYLLIKHYDNEKVFAKESKKEGGERVANYKYEILSYSKGENGKTFTLDLDGKFVNQAHLSVGAGGNISVVGFYSLKGGYMSGIFYVVVDKETKQVVTSSTKSFSKELLDVFGKKDVNKTKSKGGDLALSSTFKFRDIISREDGGVLVLAENYYVTEVTYTDSKGHTTTRYYYHYNDIIAINISPKGDIEWLTRIPKVQVGGAPGGLLSFSCMVNDKVYIIYNDNKTNEGKTDAKTEKIKYMTPKTAATVLVTLDDNGKISKKNLFDLKEQKVSPLPALCTQIDRNTMLLYSQRGKKYKFGTITVKK